VDVHNVINTVRPKQAPLNIHFVLILFQQWVIGKLAVSVLPHAHPAAQDTDDVGIQIIKPIQDPIDQGTGRKFIVIQA